MSFNKADKVVIRKQKVDYQQIKIFYMKPYYLSCKQGIDFDVNS